jgi:maltooligosyltrehalose trehalohydrolase
LKRRHAMPFGAERDADGTTRFRLWAPDATAVQLDLVHDHGHVALSMGAGEDGWHAITVPNVNAGARYQYRIDDRIRVPDPASRANPQDVHAPSAVVDPFAFEWPDAGWRGRPWEEAVIYELHVGTFTPEGTFDAIIGRLDYLAELGVTALELMPIADFPGRRGWGYDGVLPFAPEAAYGTPDDLKRLVAAAHERNLMVLLDAVYNHFGPEGNYLSTYASRFFNPRHATPWGAAVNLDSEGARVVRDFFIHNALYWLEEFHFDGLRLDAVHALVDDSRPDFLTELCAAVRDGPGRERHVHLVLENDRNQARYLEHAPPLASGQWNDDFHHAVHVLFTGERGNYYADYQDEPLRHLGRCLAEGFGYQGEASRHRGCERGEPSSHLRPTAFVNFLQCHDQIGNRAFGERIGSLVPAEQLRLAVICFLPAPAIPMLFMGEEFGASAPFLFFCDFGPDLAQAVRDGRRREFAEFGHGVFGSGDDIPDANGEASFLASRLDWDETGRAGHREWLELYRDLLALRRRVIVPRLASASAGGRYEREDTGGLRVDWPLGAERLTLLANFSAAAWRPARAATGTTIYASSPAAQPDALPAWEAVWLLDAAPTP